MTDGTIAQFIARSVIAEGGATERLVTAFHALVPEADRQEPVLGLARDEAATSALGTDPGFKGMWDNVVDMLTSYSDRSFVSDAYGKELSGARIQAMEVERVSDDPPERIAVWLGSVTDGRVRALDLQLLLDLLRIEKDEHRWDDMTIPTVAHIEDLLLMGDFEAAQGLVDVLAFEAGAEGSDLRKRSATRALDRLVNGQMMQHTVSHLRSLDELGFNQVKKLYYTLGANVIKPLTEALALEEQPRPREQLTEILIGFGALGRQSVERLKNSPNAAVRRTAVRLLREFGGQEALPELTALLDDAEPRVQREAIRAILNIATDQAYAVLKTALESGTAASRELIMQSISGLRDERAAPLFCYIIRNVDHRGRARQVYQRAIEALGAQSENDDESVEVLKEALYRGEWWAPFRTAALRLAAAAALARIGTPAALDVLREAGQLGSHGVRTAARRQLASDDRNQHAPAEEGTRPA